MWSILSVGVVAIRLATTAVEAAVAPGEVNCRYTATSSASVNYYTCTELADWLSDNMMIMVMQLDD
jgi:hypothetical protein